MEQKRKGPAAEQERKREEVPAIAGTEEKGASSRAGTEAGGGASDGTEEKGASSRAGTEAGGGASDVRKGSGISVMLYDLFR
ncbi:hypothetical protein R1sor_018292 [Riccia sorocarpa]|uniref:Uncharacterized protein n=1 Tax=Riccia sorocarpa TaxID=122646 RepID=A0ABD3ICU8_9MARC